MTAGRERERDGLNVARRLEHLVSDILTLVFVWALRLVNPGQNIFFVAACAERAVCNDARCHGIHL